MDEARRTSLHSVSTHALGKNHRVLIVIEDKGNAFNMYRDYIIRNFSISDADIIGVGGADLFYNEIKSRLHYDSYVIIYDAGVEIKKINKIRNAIEFLKINNGISKIFVFSPMCFEEVLLSFSYLRSYIDKNTEEYRIFSELQLAINGDIDDVDYFNYRNTIESVEQKIEGVVETITANTPFKYEHFNRRKGKSMMSDCWLYDCCLVDKTKDKNSHLVEISNTCKQIKLGDYANKLDLIAGNSLLGGLGNIIRQIFGVRGAGKALSKMRNYSRLVRRII